MSHKQYLIFILIICAGFLSGSAIAAGVLVNAGMLSLRDTLMAQDDLLPENYSVYDVLPEDVDQTRIANSLHQAAMLDPDNLAARWTLGRASLAVGDTKTAVDALEPLIVQAERNSLVYSDLLSAFSRNERMGDVIALYEAFSPPYPTQEFSDTVALAYLEQGMLQRALDLRPGDLYANYYLWRQSREWGDVQVATVL